MGLRSVGCEPERRSRVRGCLRGPTATGMFRPQIQVGLGYLRLGLRLRKLSPPGPDEEDRLPCR